MGDTLDTVVDILDSSGDVDNSATFDALWAVISGQAERIAERFGVVADPGYADLAASDPSGGTGSPSTNAGIVGYKGIEGEWAGAVNAYNSDEMDWMVHSWMGDPSTGFTNMHLTCWLGPHVDVPHLGFAWGTLPDLWFYMDYLPRTDPMVDYDYLQRYYEPTNERFLELKADEGLSYFTSRTLMVRQSVSHTGYCFVCTDADDSGGRSRRITQIAELAEQRVTDWFAMIDAAEPVDAADRPALAERDLHIRRLIAEKDPANALGERFFGTELTDRLVGALWGADREHPRPT